MKTCGECGTASFLNSVLMEESGQIHAPAAFSPVKNHL
jgi:hypothetical protein